MSSRVVHKIGKYEIVAELGQGGMGVVYKARDPFIGRLVALKTVTPELVSDPEILKRFCREAQSAGTLQHPNIVTIYDLGEADGRPYIAMEFVEGESLHTIIDRRPRIPLAAKLRLVQQFCEGLGHAHKRGFVHRDVKPANILVTHDGVVKIVDFGIVHLESTNLTKAGTFLGTTHYASPEQVNDGHVDSRSDLWAVTCVLYELIAYKKAFDGSNIAAIIAKIFSSDPEPLSVCCPGVPPALDSVIRSGLKKNIEERYQSLNDLLTDLLPITGSLQLGFVGEMLNEAKDLREKGNYSGAREKVRSVLILDRTRTEAKLLHTELSAEMARMGPIFKARKMVGDAEQAFNRGQLAEGARLLGEAEVLSPPDTQARDLRIKITREQERVREMRDALTAGQRLMHQGDLTAAEQNLRRVLELDKGDPPASELSQAVELLEKIQNDRLAREREFRLKEGLWQADNLVAEGNHEEAKNKLLELQQEFTTCDEVSMRLKILAPLIKSRELLRMGKQALQQGAFEDAVHLLTEAWVLDPSDPEVRGLKDRANQERDRQEQLRDALGYGRMALNQGDAGMAERMFRLALHVDPANPEGLKLLEEARQTLATAQRKGRYQDGLKKAEGLAALGNFEDAQSTLQELQAEFPEANEIVDRLRELEAQGKTARLLEEGQLAFEQGEYGEAVRILTAAEGIEPIDARVRELKARAVTERDRLRQVREDTMAGHRAMRQGRIDLAEQYYRHALQLDPANPQTAKLLADIPKHRD